MMTSRVVDCWVAEVANYSVSFQETVHLLNLMVGLMVGVWPGQVHQASTTGRGAAKKQALGEKRRVWEYGGEIYTNDLVSSWIALVVESNI